MTNEETDLYKVWVDNKPSTPTLRIEWKQTEDLLPKFIKSLEEWEQRKVYQYMRDFIEVNTMTGNKIHNFYAEYNNEKGIKYIKEHVL